MEVEAGMRGQSFPLPLLLSRFVFCAIWLRFSASGFYHTFFIPLGGNKNDFIVWQLVFFLARYKIVSSQFLTYRFLS